MMNTAGTCSRNHSALTSLPYDVLLAVSTHLRYQDFVAIRLTCKTLHEFSFTRPVYRHLAHELLRRCRPLPLDGFTRVTELSTQELVQTVNMASRFEHGWKRRAPRPAVSEDRANRAHFRQGGWYAKLKAPKDEEIDWLSPITSSYLLCATRSGKVFCWDIETDSCLAEWRPDRLLELWKCRVEFDSSEVFFTMADVISGTHEERHMEFTIMCLRFPRPGRLDPPGFSSLATFHTYGAVMNVFLLDPVRRILAAYLWLADTKSIGLYVLPDWDIKQYALLDTKINCSQSGNWSCIVHEDNIVIHAEDCDHASQHFYPLSLILRHVVPIPTDGGEDKRGFRPVVTAVQAPYCSIRRRFIFPNTPMDQSDISPPPADHPTPLYGHLPEDQPSLVGDHNNPFRYSEWYPDSCHFVRQWWPASPVTTPESVAARRISCTVVLLANHNTQTGDVSYVLAQHYFGTPLSKMLLEDPTIQNYYIGPEKSPRRPSTANARTDGSSILNAPGIRRASRKPLPVDGIPLRMFYVGNPFDIVAVVDRVMPGEDVQDDVIRERPLLAVDFGHAVWLEWYKPEKVIPRRSSPDPDSEMDGLTPYQSSQESDEEIENLVGGIVGNDPPEAAGHAGEPRTVQEITEAKVRAGLKRRLRFVTFPTVDIDEHGRETNVDERMKDSVARTLETPEELDLALIDTINVDQSQGAVFLSVKNGEIFVVYYD